MTFFACVLYEIKRRSYLTNGLTTYLYASSDASKSTTGLSAFTMCKRISLPAIALMKSLTYFPLSPSVTASHCITAGTDECASPLSVSPDCT